jgi:hypothetical protein
VGIDKLCSCDVLDLRFRISNLLSAISILKSQISILKSKILNHKSEILNSRRLRNLIEYICFSKLFVMNRIVRLGFMVFALGLLAFSCAESAKVEALEFGEATEIVVAKDDVAEPLVLNCEDR